MAARALLSSRLAGLCGQQAVSCVRRRALSAAAAARKEPVEAAGKARLTPAADKADKAAATTKDESFWMRDPKTGCWMPENHLREHDVDAADLRARLLFSSKKD